MYISLSQLNGYIPEEKKRVQERWDEFTNEKAKDLVFKLIKKGGGEDFLQCDYQNGILSNFLDNEWDLRGIQLFNENIDFPSEDNFEGIDFSYSKFYHSIFRKGYFNASFSFAKIYNCKFVSCTFHFAYWYGCTIENTSFENCDFLEQHRFTNCDFINCRFVNYSISTLLFTDCRFDSNTVIESPKSFMLTCKNRKSNFNKKQLCDHFKSIHEAYHIGSVPELSRKYKYLSQKSRTNYCSKSWLLKLRNKLLIEYLTGYGLKPLRPLIALLFTIVCFSFLYGLYNVQPTSVKILEGIWQVFFGGFWFSVSAANKLGSIAELSFPSNLFFVMEACLGTIFFSLFITVLSNTWFNE